MLFFPISLFLFGIKMVISCKFLVKNIKSIIRRDKEVGVVEGYFLNSSNNVVKSTTTFYSSNFGKVSATEKNEESVEIDKQKLEFLEHYYS